MTLDTEDNLITVTLSYKTWQYSPEMGEKETLLVRPL